MKRLEGKVAVVTGGNSGIGLATAKRLQEEGAKVVISGRSKKTLDEAVKTIGNGVVAVQADVATLTDVDKLYAEVSRKLGKIDVLFVNALELRSSPHLPTHPKACMTSSLTSTSKEHTSQFRKRYRCSMTARRSS